MLMNPHEARLAALRSQLATQGLDGFVIPICDEHMSEYVGAYAQRLEWLTGFGGSAGTAVVLRDKAAIFVDGRYTLQVRDQVDGTFYEYHNVPATSPSAWIAQNAPEEARIGFDPWLHTQPWVAATQSVLSKRFQQLEAVDVNPVDTIWADRPKPSLAPAVPHPLAHAGVSSETKRAALADDLAAKGADAAVITALDSIAWLLNIRGEDVARTPVALSFVIAHADGTANLFIAPEKVTPQLRAHLGNAVRIEPRDAFVSTIKGMGNRKVIVDLNNSVAAVTIALAETQVDIIDSRDPCVLPKAIKNPTEQAGHRAAQARDGAAVTRFLHWLSVEAPKGTVTELSAAEKLHQFRRECGDLRDLSFDTISGAGPNGAIVHYRVSEETNRKLEPSSVYLVDSGGQYPDGTTDITRTVWVGPGEAPAEERDRFTRVLKGHIALARAIFPRGTAGSQLDTLARQYLWAAGVDYAHGTGHGVGSFLAVHEGPQRIAKASGGQAGTGQELLPGMILSNEPGYYKTGAYGIRIENLILVTTREIAGAEGDYFGFETLTHVPIGRELVDPALLTAEEKAWWNDYHARVMAIIAPQVSGDTLAWLSAQCAPL